MHAQPITLREGLDKEYAKWLHLKVDSKKARALAREMQTTQMTRIPYTMSHLGSFCCSAGLQAFSAQSHAGQTDMDHAV